jgi:hypothetical protein
MNLTSLRDGNGLWLSSNNLDTDVSQELDTFISLKSPSDVDWKSSQGQVEVCRSSDFSWPMFLSAITQHE